MKKYIIDRIEGDFAVVEYDGKMQNIKLDILPKEVKAGDMLINSNGSFVIDKQENQARLQKIMKLQQELFK